MLAERYKTKGTAREKYAADGEEYATIGLHEGIIPSDVWLRVQARLLNNHNFGSSGTGTKTWLSGLVRCGYCGNGVCFKPGGRKGSKIYAICIGRIEKHCHEKKKTLTTEILEEIVEGQLLAYLNNLKIKTTKTKSSFSPQINKLKMAIKKIDVEMESYLKQVPNATTVLINLINGQVERLTS